MKLHVLYSRYLTSGRPMYDINEHLKIELVIQGPDFQRY